MNILKSTLITILALSLISCATTPTPQEMRQDVAAFQLPKAPEKGKAIVYVVRPASLGALIRFRVFVNSRETSTAVGYTRGKQYIYFNVDPGTHTILSKAENTAEAQITARPGDIIFLEQEPKPGIAISRNSISKIPSYEGKYHVKHLRLGTLKQ